MLQDLIYALPRPIWWPGPGGGPVPGFKTLICVAHQWKRLPVLINDAGSEVSVDIGRTLQCDGTPLYDHEGLLGLSRAQLVEARDFCFRFAEYVDLEEAVAAVRLRGDFEERPARPRRPIPSAPRVNVPEKPTTLAATPEQEAFCLVRELIQVLSRYEIVSHDSATAVQLLSEAVLETARWEDTMITDVLSVVMRYEQEWGGKKSQEGGG